MPVIRKLPKQKIKVKAKPKAAKGGINDILEKLKLADTPKNRAMYLKRFRVIQSQFKESGKKAA